MAFSSWRTWVTGEVVTAAHMNQEIRDNGAALFPNENASVVWTPTLEATTTNPSVSSTLGKQGRIAFMQFVWVRFVLTSTKGSGTYFVTLPNAPSGLTTSSSAFAGQAVGGWTFLNASESGFDASGTVQLATGGTARFNVDGGGFITDSTPLVVQASDILTFWAIYPYL